MTQTLTLAAEPADSARSMLSPLWRDVCMLLLLLLRCPAARCPSPASSPAPAICFASAVTRRNAGAVSAACSRSLLMTVSAGPAEARNPLATLKDEQGDCMKAGRSQQQVGRAAHHMCSPVSNINNVFIAPAVTLRVRQLVQCSDNDMDSYHHVS